MLVKRAASLSQALGFRISDCGFRISGFGFQVSGYGFRVSGFGFRISDFGFLVSVFGFRVSDFGFRVQSFRGRVQGLGKDFVVRDLGPGFRVQGRSFDCSVSRVSGSGLKVKDVPVIARTLAAVLIDTESQIKSAVHHLQISTCSFCFRAKIE